MQEAMLYEKLDQERVRCQLCRHQCRVKPGKTGICGVRKNEGGVLYSLVYDKVAARGVDPIEKKPLFHFFPGSLAYSIATMGCNFSCAHCQNCHLSRTPAEEGRIEGLAITPEEIVNDALANGCKSISYTYSEPTIFGELALDTARIARDRGLYNNFVTNGYQSPEFIALLPGLIHGANIDLKSISADFYKKVCKAKVEGVLDTIRRMHGQGIWLEITTLLIPGLNDSDREVEALAAFIAGLDKKIPWHISRYHPAYRMQDRPPTPIESLTRARDSGLAAGLRYVYTGNVPGDAGESTYCHSCGGLIIQRIGFQVRKMHLKNGKCTHCSAKAAGLFENK